MMKLVVVESPYAGDVAANVDYAKKCVVDSLRRGEAPYASHLFFTQEGILNDEKPSERRLGIAAGLAWGASAETVAFYVDRGVTPGMKVGYRAAKARGATVRLRALERKVTHEDWKELVS